jgi:hypothetical protein
MEGVNVVYQIYTITTCQQNLHIWGLRATGILLYLVCHKTAYFSPSPIPPPPPPQPNKSQTLHAYNIYSVLPSPPPLAYGTRFVLCTPFIYICIKKWTAPVD